MLSHQVSVLELSTLVDVSLVRHCQWRMPSAYYTYRPHSGRFVAEAAFSRDVGCLDLA